MSRGTEFKNARHWIVSLGQKCNKFVASFFSEVLGSYIYDFNWQTLCLTAGEHISIYGPPLRKWKSNL
jgi:hypothetical protein